MTKAEKKIRLPDGRTLGYREFGEPDGLPVINNHGGLVCGLDVAPADETATRLGIRIISPDRPGVGLSSAKVGRTLLNWTEDMRELADQLGLQKFALLGWSMGGQYALACEYALADRVTRAAVIACPIPLDDPKTFAELNRMDQRLTDMVRHHPREAEITFKAFGEVARHTPQVWNEMAAKGLCKRDVEALHALPEPGLAAMAAPALENAGGMAEEYRAWILPWGFMLSQIAGEVTVWQGTEDALIPREWGERLAREIPNARLHLLETEGHFLALEHYAEILTELKGPA